MTVSTVEGQRRTGLAHHSRSCGHLSVLCLTSSADGWLIACHNCTTPRAVPVSEEALPESIADIRDNAAVGPTRAPRPSTERTPA